MRNDESPNMAFPLKLAYDTTAVPARQYATVCSAALRSLSRAGPSGEQGSKRQVAASPVPCMERVELRRRLMETQLYR